MKERLTGAVILVALIVLLVPELLTGPAHVVPPSAPSSSEEPPLRSYTINLADDAHSKPSNPASEDPAASPLPSTAAAASQSGPTSEAPMATHSSAQPAASTPAQVSPSATQANPSPTQANPSTPAPVNRAPTASSSPPTPKPAIAHSSPVESAKHVQRTTPPVSQKPPAKPATPTAMPSGGWMVQLGVFASRDNAERLTQELKSKGFQASLSEAAGNSRKLWRVRVGPSPDRAAAERVAARLKAAGQSASIVPHS